MNDDFKFPEMAQVPLMVKDLTMRDHFAAQALQGMLSNIDEHTRRYLDRYQKDASEEIAKASWAIADAMLKARDKK
jgi:hypothetical protein